jgi:hypothetical protein
MYLVDTNVLLDLVTDDSNWSEWSLARLEEAAFCSFDHLGGTSKQRSWRGNEYSQLQVLGSCSASIRKSPYCSQSKKIFLLVSFLADLTDRRPGAS